MVPDAKRASAGFLPSPLSLLDLPQHAFPGSICSNCRFGSPSRKWAAGPGRSDRLVTTRHPEGDCPPVGQRSHRVAIIPRFERGRPGVVSQQLSFGQDVDVIEPRSARMRVPHVDDRADPANGQTVSDCGSPPVGGWRRHCRAGVVTVMVPTTTSPAHDRGIGLSHCAGGLHCGRPARRGGQSGIAGLADRFRPFIVAVPEADWISAG